MRNCIGISFCVFAFTSFWSCAYHVEDILYPPDTCDTTNVTYSGTILPIIEQFCYDCHSNANVGVSQIPLEGYDFLIVKVNDGKLIKAIRHSDPANVSPMPKDRSALEECNIEKIEKWVSQGAPNN
ncbi:MAG: hypothetical protein ABJC12_05375 [Saprospiraceae bacterium]